VSRRVLTARGFHLAQSSLLEADLAMLELARAPSDVWRYRTAHAFESVRMIAREVCAELAAYKALEVAHALDLAEQRQARAAAIVAVFS
jgi:hypothetical protein